MRSGSGCPVNWDYLHGLDFSGRIPGFAFLRCFVDFDEHRVAGEPIMQRSGDRGAIARESIGADLKRSARRCVADAFHKNICGRLVALTHRDIQHEFRMAFDGNKNVGVTEARIIFRFHTLLLLVEETEKLIAFYIAALNVANFFGHDAFALLACDAEQFQNRSVMNPGYALYARNGITFEQQLENHFRLVDGRVHSVQVIFSRLQESLGALAALIPLVTFAVVSFALTFGTAVVASHCDSPGGKSQPKSA